MTRPLAGSPDELVWLHGYEAAVIEMRKEFDNIRADERALLVGEAPRAWMRRWAHDGVEVMKLPKRDRPAGWAYLSVTEQKLLPDDVPLYAIRAAREATP